jgi:Zn-dependent peptidase ImmA (M78 family)
MATKFTYSDNEVTEIVAKYQSGTTLEVLAAEYNKSVASVRMKLVKLGVYQKAVKTAVAKGTKTEKPTTKAASKTEIRELFYSCLASVGPAPF